MYSVLVDGPCSRVAVECQRLEELTIFLAIFTTEGWIDEPQGPILVYFKETQTPSGKEKCGIGGSMFSTRLA